MNFKIQQPFASVWFYFSIFSIHFLAYPSFCIYCRQIITICSLQHQWKATKCKSSGNFTHALPHPGWQSSQDAQGRLRISIRGGKKGLSNPGTGFPGNLVREESSSLEGFKRHVPVTLRGTWFRGGLGQCSDG